MDKLRYKSGYKYQLAEEFHVDLQGFFSDDFFSASFDDYIHIYNSVLFVSRGYAWDGPSGLSIDTKNFMRGSLVHDVLYQLMRNGQISIDMREAADDLLKSICIEDGMSRFRAWYVHKAVRLFGGKYAHTPKPVLEAP